MYLSPAAGLNLWYLVRLYVALGQMWYRLLDPLMTRLTARLEGSLPPTSWSMLSTCENKARSIHLNRMTISV